MDVEAAREFEVLPSMGEGEYGSEEEDAQDGRTGLLRLQNHDNTDSRPRRSQGE